MFYRTSRRWQTAAGIAHPHPHPHPHPTPLRAMTVLERLFVGGKPDRLARPPRWTEPAEHRVDHPDRTNALLDNPIADARALGTLPLPRLRYMGDYLALTSAQGHQYFAWGDNRDRVVNFTHPHGRHDPDVFFAHR